MKILFHSHVPFQLAHGGAQIQIEQTKVALEKIGVDVDWLRWYDAAQSADLIHFFGRPPSALVRMAQAKGVKMVVGDLLTAQGSRSMARLRTQSFVMRFLEKAMPGGITEVFAWKSFQRADACTALTPWEAKLMTMLFNASPERVHVVPNGVELVFLESKPATRGKWLVCTATITERKRVLELAEAAVHANTPVWIVGKPYAESDAYAQRFNALARQHPDVIRYEGPISDRARMAAVYREARGFVLLSTMESLSLSALEAAACECPLLLSDLPWARTVFGESVSYCPITGAAGTVPSLRKFYDAAPQLKPPARPMTWTDVAKQLRDVYALVLNTSR